MKNALGLMLIAANLVLGCGSSDDSQSSGSGDGLSEATARSYEGVYELSARHVNDQSCDAEGSSVLDTTTEQRFVMVSRPVLGQQTLVLVSCADMVDCDNKVTEIRELGSYTFEYSFTFTTEAGPDDLGGFEATTGFQDGDLCVERVYTRLELTRSDETVAVDAYSHALQDKPVEDGFCVVEPASSRREAETAPCTASEALEGRRIGDI